MIQVIPLTRLNGSNFALNPDLVARADTTPDTVLTLTDGTKYVVTESLAEVVDLIVSYRAAVLRAAAAQPEVGDSWARFRVSDADDEVAEDSRAAPAARDAATATAKRSTVVRLRPRRG